MVNFTDRLVLITGATRGIGYAVARAFAAAGAHVLITGRTTGALEELYDAIIAAGGNATGLPLDLTDYDALDRLGAEIYQRWGKLDVLIGNAAMLGPITPLAHIAPDELDKIINLNVIANARLIRAMEPLLLAAEYPRAVFTSSSSAQSTRAFWGAYAASKAALDAMVKSWANEHKQGKLRANLIYPGAIRTAMRAQALPGEDPATLPAPSEIAPLFLELAHQRETRTGEIIRFGD